MVQHPAMIDIGTLSLYLNAEQVEQLLEAALHYVNITCGCNDGQEPLFEAIDYLKERQKEYQRRMKERILQ